MFPKWFLGVVFFALALLVYSFYGVAWGWSYAQPPNSTTTSATLTAAGFTNLVASNASGISVYGVSRIGNSTSNGRLLCGNSTIKWECLAASGPGCAWSPVFFSCPANQALRFQYSSGAGDSIMNVQYSIGTPLPEPTPPTPSVSVSTDLSSLNLVLCIALFWLIFFSVIFYFRRWTPRL